MNMDLRNVNYCVNSFDEFISLHPSALQGDLYESSSDWLNITSEIFLEPNNTLIIHSLTFNGDLVIAWPLIFENKHQRYSSVTSFYSSLSEPYVYVEKDSEHIMKQLVATVAEKKPWNKMTIGPLNKGGLIEKAISNSFKFTKRFTETNNWYEDNLTTFAQYYAERPSQLKNTIKRKEKKLAKLHEYQVKIITTKSEFDCYFPQYKLVYDKSWKSEEYSYDFIQKVCLKAIEENKLRFGIFLVDNETVAAQIWFIQDGTASIFKLAYNPMFKSYSVGSILSKELSEYVIDIDNVHTIEFGMGDEQYKRDWMSKCRKRVTLQVFNNQSIIGILLAFRYITLARIKAKFTKYFVTQQNEI